MPLQALQADARPTEVESGHDLAEAAAFVADQVLGGDERLLQRGQPAAYLRQPHVAELAPADSRPVVLDDERAHPAAACAAAKPAVHDGSHGVAQHG